VTLTVFGLHVPHALQRSEPDTIRGRFSLAQFADDGDPLDRPAQARCVATAHSRIRMCGSGSRRGGAVSGLGGHNAAMAVPAQI